jgi:hypothetical protein
MAMNIAQFMAGSSRPRAGIDVDRPTVPSRENEDMNTVRMLNDLADTVHAIREVSDPSPACRGPEFNDESLVPS